MSKPPGNRRPNIVLILVDQMAYDCIHALGHPTVITPNLDRLVQSGATFTNSYCNSPLCAPSRACLASGLLVRHNGVYDNGAEFSAEIPTLMHHLRNVGYETIGAGKFHFVGPDQLHGFDVRLTTDIFPADFGWTPDWSLGPVSSPGVNIQTVKNAHIVKGNKYVDYDEEVTFRTLERIRQIGRKEKPSPFFLNVSYTHPHPPFEALERYHSLYKDNIPAPNNYESSSQNRVYDDWMRTLNMQQEIPISEEEIRHARRCYYAMVSYLDHLVGQIVDELAAMGLQENTLIIFSSDHGEMLGEQGMWFKRTYYEQALRVPFIVSWPGQIRPDQRIDRVVSHVDLVATLMELAEIEDCESWLEEVDGDSFSKLLADSDTDWKDEVLFEYYGKGTVSLLCGVRKGRFKYAYVDSHETYLFDLEEDLHEQRNLSGNLKYREEEDRLREILFDGFDARAFKAQVLQSQRRRVFIRKAMGKGREISWDHEPRFDASRQYVRNLRKT
jgi:choline-sulfatase